MWQITVKSKPIERDTQSVHIYYSNTDINAMENNNNNGRRKKEKNEIIT